MCVQILAYIHGLGINLQNCPYPVRGKRGTTPSFGMPHVPCVLKVQNSKYPKG
jgi:hypothetical protein